MIGTDPKRTGKLEDMGGVQARNRRLPSGATTTNKGSVLSPKRKTENQSTDYDDNTKH